MQRVLLSGEFDHTIDPKGRITLPARYREYFSRGVVLVRFQGDEPCVRVYHPDAWREFDEKYLEPLNVFENAADSWRMREIYRNQDEVEPDKQGRVTIPAPLRQYAGLDRDLAVIGAGSRVEIWDAVAWADYLSIQETAYSETAEEVIPGLF